MTVGITDDDDYYTCTHTHTHRARAYFCISRSFPLGFLRLYDGDRIGLRILLLSSLDRSDSRDLARVKVTEVFDELDIAHHDELLDDVGTIHPFCVRTVWSRTHSRTRGAEYKKRQGLIFFGIYFRV